MRSRLVLILVSTVSLFTAAPARADDVMIGLRGGYYFDASEPFLGAEFLVRIAHSVYFNPNFEYVFFDDHYYTVNADFHYDFPTRGDSYVWAGMGLGLVAIDPPGRAEQNTDAALNLLFGIGLSRGSLVPYLQAKAIVADNSEFSLGFGLRF